MLSLLVASQAGAVGYLSLVPIRATGSHYVVGNEIFLETAGQLVFLEAYVWGWDPGGFGTPRVRTAHWAVGNPSFFNDWPGQLSLARPVCEQDEFCEALFENSFTRCASHGNETFKRCEGAFHDQSRADWFFAAYAGEAGSAFWACNNSSPDFVACGGGIDRDYPGVADNGTVYYVGTAVIEIPPDAYGTFAFSFDRDSFLQDESEPVAQTIALTSAVGAVIHVADPRLTPKSRFISARPQDWGSDVALRVMLTSLHHPDPPYAASPFESADFSSFEGQIRWVGPPQQFVENENSESFYWAAPLQCEPYYETWDDIDALNIYGAEIVPSSVYKIERLDPDCVDLNDDACYTTIANIATTRYGDIVEPFASTDGTTQPNMLDVAAVVDKFKGAASAPVMARVILRGNVPDLAVNMTDISYAINAFRGQGYPFSGPSECP